LFTTAYSVYSQLLFISGGHFLHPQPKDVSYRGDMDPAGSCEHGNEPSGYIKGWDLLNS